MTLEAYFKQPTRARAALESYADFAIRRNWSIPVKLEMYKASKVAFNSDADQITKMNCFGSIYAYLVGNFQVARNGGLAWNDRGIFEMLVTACNACSQI